MGVRTRLRGWRGRSRIAQVDSFMRWALYLLPFLFPLLSAAGLLGAAGRHRPAAALLLALSFAQCFLGIGLSRRALECYLRKRAAPWGRLACSGALLLASLVALAALVRTGGTPTAANPGGGVVLQGHAFTFFGSFSLLVRVRRYLAWCAAGAGAMAVVAASAGGGVTGAAGAAFTVLFFTAWALCVRSTGWVLAVMWEAEAARGVQARLAVTEERLRFSRDMHDVLGRNLAVIALKSELAEQLARRGSPAALEQLAEVRHLAQESQREMREVVRGYREADLHTELVGARGVLAAAGIECRIEDSAGAELPEAVQSTLAWVVREGTTNVLRHADARRCAVRLRVAAESAVLIMENDGVPGTARAVGDGEGSGLAGLRERLTALGGALTAERRPRGMFRVTAELPVRPAGAGQDGADTGRPAPHAVAG